MHVFKWKFQISHQDAEDALQEAVIKFIRNICDNKFREDCSICTFLSGITKNECINILRKNKEPILDDIERFCPEFLDCQICISEVLDEFEKNVVERLKVLKLQFEGCSIKEIASKVNRSEGATKAFIFECKKKIKLYLKRCLSECG